MRGDEERQESIILFASLEDRIPCDHPLREIRRVVDRALNRLLKNDRPAALDCFAPLSFGGRI